MPLMMGIAFALQRVTLHGKGRAGRAQKLKPQTSLEWSQLGQAFKSRSTANTESPVQCAAQDTLQLQPWCSIAGLSSSKYPCRVWFWMRKCSKPRSLEYFASAMCLFGPYPIHPVIKPVPACVLWEALLDLHKVCSLLLRFVFLQNLKFQTLHWFYMHLLLQIAMKWIKKKKTIPQRLILGKL